MFSHVNILHIVWNWMFLLCRHSRFVRFVCQICMRSYILYFENKIKMKSYIRRGFAKRMARVKMIYSALLTPAITSPPLLSEALKIQKPPPFLPLFHRNEVNGVQGLFSSSDEWFIHQKHLTLDDDMMTCPGRNVRVRAQGLCVNPR